LLPFIRVPERINHADPAYLATILDRAVPVFVSSSLSHTHESHPDLIAIVQEHIQRTYVFIPRTNEQMILLAGLLRLVSAVSQLAPTRACAGWAAFVPLAVPATSPSWDTVRG
jgi:hypothetical protein